MTSYRVLARSGEALLIESRVLGNEPQPWLRVIRAGVCGTDIQIFRGVRRDVARVLGHEGVAQISHAGSSDSAGYVTFNPVDCANQDRILGHSHDGVFSEMAFPAAGSVVAADPDLVCDLAPLLEPLATVLYAWELISRIRQPAELGIWGGGSAAMLAALAAELNGSHCHVFHPRRARLDWLRERVGLRGATWHCTLDPVIQGSRPFLDAAILATSRDGAAESLEQASALVRDDGVLDLFGGFTGGDTSSALPGLDLGAVRRGNTCGQVGLGGVLTPRRGGGRVWVTGHRGSSDAQILAAQRILVANASRFAGLVTHVISLPYAAAFIPRLYSEPAKADYLKVVIDLTLADAFRDPDPDTRLRDLAPHTPRT